MATLAVPIVDSKEAFNPNAVKWLWMRKVLHCTFLEPLFLGKEIVLISHDEIGEHYLRHIGIYAYRAGFIRRYITWEPSPLESIEMLEQLRVLWYGEKIHVAKALEVPGVGVDTQDDLIAARAAFRALNQEF